MSRNVRYILVLTIAFICQATIVPFVSIGAARPDIVLIAIATFGFIDGPVAGAVGGFFGGLLQDLVAAGSLGLTALAKTLAGYISGQAERTILGSSLLLPVVVIAGISVISQIIYVGLAFLMGEPLNFGAALRVVVFPSAAYTALVSVPVFPYLSRLLSSQRQSKVFK